MGVRLWEDLCEAGNSSSGISWPLAGSSGGEEKKPKWLAKSVPNYAPLVIECCMDLMLEVEDGMDKLKEWAERMDDEEGEEDADELYHFGEEAIDRVVEAIGMESASSALFTLVGRFSQQPQWQAKLAALTAVKQTVEYVEDLLAWGRGRPDFARRRAGCCSQCGCCRASGCSGCGHHGGLHGDGLSLNCGSIVA